MTPFQTHVTMPANTVREVQSPLKSPAERARETAIEFEAVFLTQMLNLMQPSFEGDLFHGGQTEDQFRSFMNENLGREMAKRGGIGIADDVYAELIRIQEGRQ